MKTPTDTTEQHDPADIDDVCWQCDGFGMVAGCFEDTCCGADCDPDDPETCCSPRRCDICNPKPRAALAKAGRE